MRVWSFFFHPEPPKTQHEKLPHALGQGCVSWRKNVKNICFPDFESNVQTNQGFLHIQLKIWKNVFLHFYASGCSPSNHRGEGACFMYFSPVCQKWLTVTEIVWYWAHAFFVRSGASKRACFYHVRKISQKVVQPNWFILLSFGILIDFFEKLFFCIAPVNFWFYFSN